MPVIVQKYGGTSVADPARIKVVADRVRDSREAGNDLVVVVSAMGKTTDTLAALAAEITSSPTPRELDMLLTAGERITMALLAMALHDRGIDAVSFTGSQAGILTDSSHGDARITRITGERVRKAVNEGKVAIVAGFQGVDPETKEVTTLGRGGSDTTAVALAAALGAETCQILTDVPGVFSADPRLVPQARLLDSIGYEDMLDLAKAGAGVLMPDSVEYAMANGVRVQVLSSLAHEGGTLVTGESPRPDVVGLGCRLVGGNAVVTVVGASAAARLPGVMMALAVTGVRVLDSGSDGRGAFVEVDREQSDAAVRSIHDEVFGSEEAT